MGHWKFPCLDAGSQRRQTTPAILGGVLIFNQYYLFLLAAAWEWGDDVMESGRKAH